MYKSRVNMVWVWIESPKLLKLLERSDFKVP